MFVRVMSAYPLHNRFALPNITPFAPAEIVSFGSYGQVEPTSRFLYCPQAAYLLDVVAD
jgi:hypothetical protein